MKRPVVCLDCDETTLSRRTPGAGITQDLSNCDATIGIVNIKDALQCQGHCKGQALFLRQHPNA